MIEMVRQLYRSIIWHRERDSFWEEIKVEVRSRLLWNTVYISVIMLFALYWDTNVLPIDAQAFGILLVGMGAVKLAHVTARAHIGDFYETTHAPDAVDRKLTFEAYPRRAGNLFDVLVGFILVAIGFMVRIGADLAGL